MESRADTHVHTKYSGLARIAFLRFPESVSEPRDVVKKAKSIGLNTVCITDHNTIQGALLAQSFAKNYDGINVVIGEEISTIDGEVIGLYLNEEVPKGLSAAETIEIIKAQGALTVAPHPFSMHVPALGLKVDKLSIDALEVVNAGHVDGYSNDKAWQHAQSGKWALAGGSDSHSLNTIGCAYTQFEGSSEEDFRRAILSKTTKAFGDRMPMNRVIQWSFSVILQSDRLILKSMLNKNWKVGDNDPVIKKVRELPTHKKIAALFGSLAYFTPPVSYLAMIAGERFLKRINSVPIHEVNGKSTRIL